MKKFILALAASVGLSYGMMSFNHAEMAEAQKAIAPALKFGDPLPANAFVELAKLINPAVVNISTSTMPKNPNAGMRGRDPFFDMLEELYGLRPAPQQQMRPQQALGTGFIIREDGLIVTNNHVIAGADKIQVQLNEKSKMYDAKLIGSDERTDIALIKINTKDKFAVAPLGTSNDLEVGEWVAAFGNPYGQGHTMTKGIISAKGREIGEINKFPLIQTDTPINPGNSGGPLVNMRGQVIGVNSAIDARAQGIGFAIPIDEVRAILPQLEKEGRIKKGFLGVSLADLNPQAAQYLGLKEPKGALIAGVDPKSPAGRAGILPYDVIVEFNGKEIESALQFSDAVADLKVGSQAKVKLIREGKVKNLEVTIADRPESPRVAAAPAGPPVQGQKAPNDLGFSMADSNSQLRRQFRVQENHSSHPIVIGVEPGSKADEVGMMPGDVILEVNRKLVKSTGDVTKNLKGGTNTLRIARGPAIAIIVF
ncbi:MAG: trypsin-like peptidase domain-containing protein [Pseudobdellovibrionaceae bacterium]